MIKWINKLIGKKLVAEDQPRRMSDEERFILSHKPQDVRDVEYWSREYDRLSYNRKSFGFNQRDWRSI